MPSLQDLESPCLSICFKPGVWIAMDEDGTWYAYTSRPRMSGDEWRTESGSVRRMSSDLFTLPLCGHWKESLTQIK